MITIIMTMTISITILTIILINLGDLYSRKEQVENIMMECVDNYIRKAAVNKSNDLALVGNHLHHYYYCNQLTNHLIIGMKMASVPDLSLISSALQNITDLNLSKNYLFNVEQIFNAISSLVSIKKLNLSYNSLNGLLPLTCSLLSSLEDINLEVNQITSLSPIVGKWRYYHYYYYYYHNYRLTVIIIIITIIIIIIIIVIIIIISKLKSFNIADNGLRAIPEEFSECTDLVSLNFRNNKVEELPASIFTKCTQLQRYLIG